MSAPNHRAGDVTPAAVSPGRAYLLLATLGLGYLGVYLCRKNFTVANPLIREAFGLSKEQVGWIATYGTLAYMIGKFAFGPLVDRLGGRVSFLCSLLLVALFGAAGGLAGSLPLLTLCYSLNRLAGSAGWGAVVKLVPDWFPARRLPFAMAILSLSFVFGGALAMVLAGLIAAWSGNDWRWVMSGPSLVLVAIFGWCWLILPPETQGAPTGEGNAPARPGFQFRRVLDLLFLKQLWVICALSFALTLLRETFNAWAVDFFTEIGGAEMSTRMAAFLSTPFDVLGAAGILLLGWAFGRLGPAGRARLLFVILAVLAILVFLLPRIGARSVWHATLAVGGIGFLAYGPYSLLAGVLSVEIRGPEYVATVIGLVDGVGYLAAILAGQQFGWLLDVGGYSLGFTCLAAVVAAGAVLCLFLYRGQGTKGAVVR